MELRWWRSLRSGALGAVLRHPIDKSLHLVITQAALFEEITETRVRQARRHHAPACGARNLSGMGLYHLILKKGERCRTARPVTRSTGPVHDRCNILCKSSVCG